MERINIIGWKRYVLVQPPLMMVIFAQAITSNYKLYNMLNMLL